MVSATMYQTWMSLPVFVVFINFSVISLFHCTQAVTTKRLCPVYSSMLRNSVYRALRVLSRGQNYRFRTVEVEEPLMEWFIRHHTMT